MFFVISVTKKTAIAQRCDSEALLLEQIAQSPYCDLSKLQ
jgi:hypothetical protein